MKQFYKSNLGVIMNNLEKLINILEEQYDNIQN